MARATRNWAHLDKMPVVSQAAVAAEVEAIAASSADLNGGAPGVARQVDRNIDDAAPNGPPGTGTDTDTHPDAVSPVELERRLHVLIACDDAIERRLGDVLHGMSQRNDWATLGFRSLGHYATERLGMPRSTAYARAAIVRELEGRPLVLEAYREGQIRFEPAQLLADILKDQPCEAEVERAWIKHAQEVTVKRLRDERQYFRRQALDGNDAAPMPLHDDEAGCPPHSTEATDGASDAKNCDGTFQSKNLDGSSHSTSSVGS